MAQSLHFSDTLTMESAILLKMSGRSAEETRSRQAPMCGRSEDPGSFFRLWCRCFFAIGFSSLCHGGSHGRLSTTMCRSTILSPTIRLSNLSALREIMEVVVSCNRSTASQPIAHNSLPVGKQRLYISQHIQAVQSVGNFTVYPSGRHFAIKPLGNGALSYRKYCFSTEVLSYARLRSTVLAHV
jgi:hypothetical protein